MADSRLPKAVYFGELRDGKRPQGRPRLRYKDALNMRFYPTNKASVNLEMMARDRSNWRHTSTLELKLPVITGYAVKIRDTTELTQTHQGVLRARTATKSVQVLRLKISQEMEAPKLHNQLTSSLRLLRYRRTADRNNR